MPRHGIHHRWTEIDHDPYAISYYCRRCGLRRITWLSRNMEQYVTPDHKTTVAVHPVRRAGVPRCVRQR